jgi:N-acetylmuramoyl-L-alanine amidase
MITTTLAHSWSPAVNFGERKSQTDMLVLHYTGMKSGPAAVKWLCTQRSGVSCHYLVDVDGAITQMVCESKRAWHAGKSFWRGNDDINSCSVGIEIQNEGHPAGNPPFPDRQISAVIALSKDIIARNDIPANRVLGHSDVAPGRKVDPGEHFPWAVLARHGVGFWPQTDLLKPQTDLSEVIGHLGNIGYDCRSESNIKAVLKSFQMHFRPMKVDGEIDRETACLVEAIALGRAAKV